MQGLWLIAFIVQWILVLILILLVIGILRYLAYIQERWSLAIPAISRYELKQQIDDFELPDTLGVLMKSRDLFQQSGAVILFVTVDCQSCLTLLAQVSELVTRKTNKRVKPFIVVALGTLGKVEKLLDVFPGLASPQVVVLIDEEGKLLHQFGIGSLPTGFVIDHKGRLVSQTFNPHAANWLYAVTEVTPPEQPVVQGSTGVIIPAAYKG